MAIVSSALDELGPGEHPPGPCSFNRETRQARARSGTVFEALLEAAGVALLGPRQRLEPLRDLLEALVARRAGKARVHLGVLVGLAGDRRLQVVGGRADGDTRHRVADFGEEVEVAERVAGLTFG